MRLRVRRAAAPTPTDRRSMSPFARWLLLVLGVLVVGTGLFLISWDIPAPVERIEKSLSDERFPR
jgi:hypothetical protein